MDQSQPADDGWLASGRSDPADVAAYYDRWAADYDADLEAWSYRAPEVVADLVRRHAPDAMTVLDAGCGTGLTGTALRVTGFTGDVVGVDLSMQSLREARRRGAHRGVACADLQAGLPVRSDACDAVVCVGVMTYVPDVEACCREFARVTRPGGSVVMTQREDIWDERDTAGVVQRLATDGLWRPVLVSDVQPYLPGHADFAERLGVHYVAAIVA